MCGFAGIMGGYTREGLEKAKDELQHRGPDDSGIFEDPAHRVGLVHTRLSILDLSPAGHQPMVSADGKVVLVFPGCLDSIPVFPYHLPLWTRPWRKR